MWKTKKSSPLRVALTFALGTLFIVGNALGATGALSAALLPSTSTVAFAEAQPPAPGNAEALDNSTQPIRSPSAVETSMAIQAIREEFEQKYGEFNDWTHELRAEYSQTLKDKGLSEIVVYGAPAEGDVPEEAALQTFKDYMVEKLSITAETLTKFKYYTTYQITNPDQPVWVIAASTINPEDYQELGGYFCEIDARTGEILQFLTPADAVG